MRSAVRSGVLGWLAGAGAIAALAGCGSDAAGAADSSAGAASASLGGAAGSSGSANAPAAGSIGAGTAGTPSGHQGGTGGAVEIGAAGNTSAGSPAEGGAPPQVAFDAELRTRAQAGMVPLGAWYNTDTGLWNKNDWWTSANQLETAIDYTRETGDPQYSGEIANTFLKNSKNDFDKWGYYDDDGWWALAWIKAYDLSHQQKYLDMAKAIFKRMTGGWDDKCGGGIYWASTKAGTDGRKNKNAIPNSLFLTAAARLHLRTPGDAGAGSFLDWAEREWAWFKTTGMLTADHQVIDSLDGLTTCKPSGPIFTYNDGSLIGGLVDLAASTGESAVLAEANAIAHATITKMADKNGILNEAPCGGEICVQFKGVFMRNLAYLNRAKPLPEYKAYMRLQGDNLWSVRNAQNQFPYQWQAALKAAEVPSASRQSSALDALLAAVRSSSPNVALGAAKITASAPPAAPCLAAEVANNANDGSSREDSKWCSAGASDQTLTVDLGSVRSLVGFRVRHAGAGGESPALNTRDFEIAISADNQAWTPAVVVVGNTSDVTTHGVPPSMARSVRLHVTHAQTEPSSPAARIYELEVFAAGL